MIPHEKALVKRLENQPFALVGINTDENQEDHKQKAREQGVTWRSSWQGSTRGPLCRAWGVTSFPTIYVLDAKGVIRAIGVRGEAMDKVVDELLAEMAQIEGAAPPKPAPKGEEKSPEETPRGPELPALESTPSAPAPRDREREYEALAKAYRSEEQAYWSALEALESRRPQAEPSASAAPHPAIAAWPRFEALAQQESARALFWLAAHVPPAFPSRPADENRRETLRLHGRIVGEHANDPAIREWTRQLSALYLELGEEAVDTLVADFAARSTQRDAVAEALYRAAAQARRSKREGAEARANALTERLARDFPETEHGRKAETEKHGREAPGEDTRPIGFDVGKLAPDFTTTDADGQTFKLSDYRGKVVVLDFWGFW